MSAHMCSERQLTIMAVYAVNHCKEAIPYTMRSELMRSWPPANAWQMTVARVFSMLVSENLASLGRRYPNDKSNEATFDMYAVDHAPAGEVLPAINIIKLCHHYAYQSCEHDGWQDSDARKLVSAIESHAVRNLPGYEAAPWGL